jgi:hypothetical protein
MVGLVVKALEQRPPTNALQAQRALFRDFLQLLIKCLNFLYWNRQQVGPRDVVPAMHADRVALVRQCAHPHPIPLLALPHTTATQAVVLPPCAPHFLLRSTNS